MHVRRLRPATAGLGLIFLFTIGCSSNEDVPMDPGVSPFYPGPEGTTKALVNPNGMGGPFAGRTGPAGTLVERDGGDPADSPASDVPIKPEDIERHLRTALRTAEKGDTAKAVKTLDRILEIEPLNREALLGRAYIGLAESAKAPGTLEGAAALEKALTLMRTLRRAYDKPTKPETVIFARMLYAQARSYATQGQPARALTTLKEAYASGIDTFDQVEKDEAMASVRAMPEYQTWIKTVDETNLARARKAVGTNLDQPLDFAFDFQLNDIDGKPLSLAQFKGKVVVVDMWGTWCKPCVEALPGLIQLYHKHHRRGLEIVGLAYEQTPSPEEARELVKKVVQGSGIPYRCAVIDEEFTTKIPNFNSFPTTLVLDKSGKVRLLVTENTQNLQAVLDAVVQVLTAEPADVKAEARPKEPPAATPAQPATAPPAATKDAAKPK